MEVIWGNRAKSSFSKIRIQIKKQFTLKEEAKFVKQVFETISIIEQFPNAYPKTENKIIKGAQKALIHPQCTLFYRQEKKSKIRILLFWDNRRDPKKIS